MAEARAAAVEAWARVEAMRLRWRRRLLECSRFHHNTDAFLWDDGQPLEAHPYRVRDIAAALRLEARAAGGYADDWAEALPAKVLLCKDPTLMLALQCWDRPIAPPRPPRPAEPRDDFVCVLGRGATRREALLGGGRHEPQPPEPTPAPSVSVRVEVVTAAAGGRPDLVGCYMRKPCIAVPVAPARGI